MATMREGLDLAETRSLLSAAAKAVIADKDRLTKADQDIGDGDHGVGMARGFAAFDEATAKEAGSIADLLRNCGKALMMASGGASGVIFGTMFQGAGKALTRSDFRRGGACRSARRRAEGRPGAGKGQGRRQDDGRRARARRRGCSQCVQGWRLDRTGSPRLRQRRLRPARRLREAWSQRSARRRVWASGRSDSSIRAR